MGPERSENAKISRIELQVIFFPPCFPRKAATSSAVSTAPGVTIQSPLSPCASSLRITSTPTTSSRNCILPGVCPAGGRRGGGLGVWRVDGKGFQGWEALLHVLLFSPRKGGCSSTASLEPHSSRGGTFMDPCRWFRKVRNPTWRSWWHQDSADLAEGRLKCTF